jgi:hypothetical protein
VAGGSSAGGFSNASGSWVEPSVNCTGSSSYSAFWVGLGGSGLSSGSGLGSGSGYGSAGGSTELEQAGTEADCNSGGSAAYFAWYELVPSAPVRLGLTIQPGDTISTKVSVSGSQATIEVIDSTSGQSASKTLDAPNPDTSSAEWITEAPSSCDQTAGGCQPLPLSDFGSVKFTSAFATDSSGHTGPISDSGWSANAVALSPTDGTGDGATPSALSTDGSTFTVSPSAASSSSGDPTAGYGGYGSDGGGGYGGGGYGGYGGGGYGGYGTDGGYGGDGYGYGGGYGYDSGGYGYYGSGVYGY